MKPYKGLQFLHTRVMEHDNSPMRYVVTKVARGTVYYRPTDGGGLDCCATEDFARYAKPAPAGRCSHCVGYFARYQCGARVGSECDCPKCQGYCTCPQGLA